METKPLLWVSTVMAICMSSRRFMGREWLVRDDFGIKFLVTFPGLYTFHLHSSHYIGCSQHVWLSRCGMSKGAEGQWAKVTEWLSLGCCEGTIDDFDKDGAPVCFGVWHILVGHIGHTPFTLFTRCPECSQVFDLRGCDHWDVCYVLLCASMWLKAIFFHCCSLQILSTVTNFVHFLVHSNRTHEFLADNWWWRSTVAALTCGVAATWQPLAACLGPRPNQYSPRNHWYVYCIRIYYISLHIYVYIYICTYMHDICTLYYNLHSILFFLVLLYNIYYVSYMQIHFYFLIYYYYIYLYMLHVYIALLHVYIARM